MINNLKSFSMKMIDGTVPALDFIESLDPKLKAKMYHAIILLEENGPSLRAPESKNLQDGIFELRQRIGTNSVRILYFFFFGRKAILTNGFVKKTQKTPLREIEKAKRYRDDFLLREGGNNEH